MQRQRKIIRKKENKKSKKRVVAIIQARMGSTRLPGKVLIPILGRPMLLYIVERLRLVKEIDEVVVATSERPDNDAIRNFCKEHDVKCFSGSENNVLDRFYKAAKENRADVLVRVTGDCPLIDPDLVRKVVKEFLSKKKYDLFSIATGAGASEEKFNGYRYPDGLDAEVFSFEALETAWKDAKEQLEIEHVTPFIWLRPQRFKVDLFRSKTDYSKMRWVVDNEDDFKVIELIYNALYKKKPDFGIREVLDFFKQHPELLEKNSHFIGEEGYQEFWKVKQKIVKQEKTKR